MARITVEDCLEKVANRFELVHVASHRAKELLKGAEPLVESENKEVVTALREIAAGKVWPEVAQETVRGADTHGQSDATVPLEDASESVLA